MSPVVSRVRKKKITVNGLMQRETNIPGINGRAFEQSIARNIQIMTYKSFMFIDDPAGADKCKRDNPDALIIQLITIDPAICRHRPCKHPACTCPQKYLGYALSLGVH